MLPSTSANGHCGPLRGTKATNVNWNGVPYPIWHRILERVDGRRSLPLLDPTLTHRPSFGKQPSHPNPWQLPVSESILSHRHTRLQVADSFRPAS